MLKRFSQRLNGSHEESKIEERAVSLEFLRAYARFLQKQAESAGFDYERLTTQDVVHGVGVTPDEEALKDGRVVYKSCGSWSIRKMSRNSQTNFVDFMKSSRFHEKQLGIQKKASEVFGPLTFFVSHAWGLEFHVLLESLERFCESNQEGRDAMFWLDIFAVNQHSTDEEFLSLERIKSTTERELVAMPNIINNANGVLLVCVPLVKPVVLGRAWCWNEVAAALHFEKSISLALCDSSLQDLKDIMVELEESATTNGSSDKSRKEKTNRFFDYLKNLEAGDSRCQKRQDMERIHELLMSFGGSYEHDAALLPSMEYRPKSPEEENHPRKPSKFEQANRQMRKTMANVVVAAAKREHVGYTDKLAPLYERLLECFENDLEEQALLKIELAEQYKANGGRMDMAIKECEEAVEKLDRIVSMNGLTTKNPYRAACARKMARVYNRLGKMRVGQYENIESSMGCFEQAQKLLDKSELILDPFRLKLHQYLSKRLSGRGGRKDGESNKIDVYLNVHQSETSTLRADALYWSARLLVLHYEYADAGTFRPKRSMEAVFEDNMKVAETQLELAIQICKGLAASETSLDLDTYGGSYAMLGKLIDLEWQRDPQRARQRSSELAREQFQAATKVFPEEDSRKVFYTLSLAWHYKQRGEFQEMLDLLYATQPKMDAMEKVGKVTPNKYVSLSEYYKPCLTELREAAFDVGKKERGMELWLSVLQVLEMLVDYVSEMEHDKKKKDNFTTYGNHVQNLGRWIEEEQDYLSSRAKGVATVQLEQLKSAMSKLQQKWKAIEKLLGR